MSLVNKIKNYKCVLPILILLGVGLFNSIYFIFLKTFCKKKRAYQCDLLNFRVFDWGKTCCSAWPVSHFILFFILGLFFPDCWLVLLTIGAMWEVLEFTAGTFQKNKGVKNDGKLQYTGKWWQANIYDIFFNTAGFFVGFGINKLWHKKNRNISGQVYNKSVKDREKEKREKEKREKEKREKMTILGSKNYENTR